MIEYGDWSKAMPSGFSFENQGIGGLRIDSLTKRSVIWQEDVGAETAVVLMIGINNITRQEELQEIKEDYLALLKSLSTSKPRLIVYGVLHQGHNRYREAVKELNQHIAKQVNTLDFEFVDLNPLLAPDEVLEPAFTLDGTHLTDEAYAMWYQDLRSRLRSN